MLLAKKILLILRHYKDKCNIATNQLLKLILLLILVCAAGISIFAIIYLFGKYSPIANTYIEINNDEFVHPCDNNIKSCVFNGFSTFVLICIILFGITAYCAPKSSLSREGRLGLLIYSFIAFFIYCICYNVQYIGYVIEENDIIRHQDHPPPPRGFSACHYITNITSYSTDCVVVGTQVILISMAFIFVASFFVSIVACFFYLLYVCCTSEAKNISDVLEKVDV